MRTSTLIGQDTIGSACLLPRGRSMKRESGIFVSEDRKPRYFPSHSLAKVFTRIDDSIQFETDLGPASRPTDKIMNPAKCAVYIWEGLGNDGFTGGIIKAETPDERIVEMANWTSLVNSKAHIRTEGHFLGLSLLVVAYDSCVW
jgi:hypothetical protein